MHLRVTETAEASLAEAVAEASNKATVVVLRYMAWQRYHFHWAKHNGSGEFINASHQWNEVKVGGKWYIIDSQCNASSGFLAFFLSSKKSYQSSGMKWDVKKYQAVSSHDYSSQKIDAAVNGYRCFYMTDIM